MGLWVSAAGATARGADDSATAGVSEDDTLLSASSSGATALPFFSVLFLAMLSVEVRSMSGERTCGDDEGVLEAVELDVEMTALFAVAACVGGRRRKG